MRPPSGPSVREGAVNALLNREPICPREGLPIDRSCGSDWTGAEIDITMGDCPDPVAPRLGERRLVLQEVEPRPKN